MFSAFSSRLLPPSSIGTLWNVTALWNGTNETFSLLFVLWEGWFQWSFKESSKSTASLRIWGTFCFPRTMFFIKIFVQTRGVVLFNDCTCLHWSNVKLRSAQREKGSEGRRQSPSGYLWFSDLISSEANKDELQEKLPFFKLSFFVFKPENKMLIKKSFANPFHSSRCRASPQRKTGIQDSVPHHSLDGCFNATTSS